MRSKIISVIHTAKPCLASGLVQFTTKEGFRYMSHPLVPNKWRIMLEATAVKREVDSKPCTVDMFRSLGMPCTSDKMPSFVIPKPTELATAKVDLEGLDRVSVAESLGLEEVPTSVMDPNQPRKALESLMMIGMEHAKQVMSNPAGWTETT